MSELTNDAAPATSLPRAMWKVLEPYHAMIYFAPEARAAYSEAGLKGYWMGYFASRAAAMGPVGPEVVAATFYNFHPRMVARAIGSDSGFHGGAVCLAGEPGRAEQRNRRRV